MYDGWVYIAKSDTGHYKIGRSKTPVERVKHFDTIMPVEVKVIAMIPCDDYVAAEKLLHWQYGEHKDFRVKGEWFSIPDFFADRLTSIICFLDGEFIERMDYGANKGTSPVANSCCIVHIDKLIECGMMRFTDPIFNSPDRD